MIPDTALILLLILIVGLVIPELFRRLKLPYITGIIILGAILGPLGLGYIDLTPELVFFGFLGSAFLMLMAGLEVELKYFQKTGKKIFIMAICNGVIPFFTGMTIIRLFGYGWFESIMMGTIFISSSAAVIISAVKSANLTGREIGKSIMAATVIEDVLSLLILALILQKVNPIIEIPIIQYMVILLVSIILLRTFMQPIAEYLLNKIQKLTGAQDVYEDELHLILILMIAVLVYFSFLGVHPIVAAFLVGILLSDTITSRKLSEKIHALGYGLFIPVFFFIIGMELDLGALLTLNVENLLIVLVPILLILSKVFSGWLGARVVGYTSKEGLLFGIASTAQLTTTLAVVYAAANLNILDQTLISSVIVLSIATTIFSPIVLNLVSKSQF